MPKFVSQAAQQAIAQRTGVSPVVIVSILWGLDLRWYSSRKANIPRMSVDPRILSTGDFSCDKKADNRGSTGNFDFTLDDSDGALKFYFDNTLAEKTQAQAFLWIDGTGFGDRILLLAGNLSNLVWDDDNRKVSLVIESATEKNEIGYAPTQEDFTDLSPQAVGVAWPLVFGTVSNVPCVRAEVKTTGFLTADIKLWGQGYYIDTTGPKWTTKSDTKPKVYSYVLDGTAWQYKPDVIYIQNPEDFPQNKSIILQINSVYFQGQFDQGAFKVEIANYPKYQNVKLVNLDNQYASEILPNNADLLDMTGANYARVIQLKDATVSLANTFCYFQYKNRLYCNYCVKQINNLCYFKNAFIDYSTGKPRLLTGNDSIISVFAIANNGMISQDLETHWNIINQNLQAVDAELMAIASQSGNAFWGADSGTIVTLYDKDSADLYIASAIKMSTIDSVFGKRMIRLSNGKQRKLLTAIPTQYYTKQLTSNYKIQGQAVSGLEFKTPLSEYQGQEWEDIVYISGQSTLGPNAVDIIKYIIHNYTDLQTDGTFSAVRSKTDDINFAIFERRNALQFANEIAWQARCALTVDSGLVSIIFMGEAPSPIMTFNESNIDEKSIEMLFTETSDIVTRLIASWTDTYKDTTQPQTINNNSVRNLSRILKALVPDTYKEKTATQTYTYRENINIFGLNSSETNVYIFNNQDSVKRTIDFWGHRGANCWKLIQFTTSDLRALILQAFDGVTISVNSAPIVINVVGQVETVKYNSQKKQVFLKVWLPIKSGESFQDSKAYTG